MRIGEPSGRVALTKAAIVSLYLAGPKSDEINRLCAHKPLLCATCSASSRLPSTRRACKVVTVTPTSFGDNVDAARENNANEFWEESLSGKVYIVRKVEKGGRAEPGFAWVAAPIEEESNI